MIKYTLGATYNRELVDPSKETIPQNQMFKMYEDDEIIYEERGVQSATYLITRALRQGEITELDKVAISVIATFGSCCITKHDLSELLKMLDVECTKERLDRCICRMQRFGLITVAHFKRGSEAPATSRIIILSNNGSQLAKSLGVVHRYNPINAASMTPAIAKSRCQTTQLIVHFLKNISIDSFKVRPVIVKNPDEGAIVRPAASIVIDGQYINFEVPRRHAGWKEDLMDKLNRYLLVFDKENMPAIVINGEDGSMNLEIFLMLKENNFCHDVLFTDDLALFGPSFKYALYSFNSNESRQCFEILT